MRVRHLTGVLYAIALRLLPTFGLIGALGGAAEAGAATYTAEYVFGDSLSDNGNWVAQFYPQGIPTPASYHQSFTNGPVAADVLARALNLSLTPSLWMNNYQDTADLFGGAGFTPGTNYAVAGASAAPVTAGGPTGYNLGDQVAAYRSRSNQTADSDALYMIMIGTNDVRHAAVAGSGTSAIDAGVAATLAAIQSLTDIGARNFLIVNVDDIGATPEFAQNAPDLAATATSLSVYYDQELAAGLAGQSLTSGVNLQLFDLYGFVKSRLADGTSYGLSNTTDPYYANPFANQVVATFDPSVVSVSDFAFWDAIHPSGTLQSLIGDGLFESISSVPEPDAWLLFVVGFGAVGMVVRRQNRPLHLIR